MNQDQLREELQQIYELALMKQNTFVLQKLHELIQNLTATQQAAPSQVAEERAYGYAKRLAESIWERHYKDVSPNWEAMDTLIGILTQIDNMAAGLLEASAQREQPAETVTCVKCGHENVIQEGKAPCQVEQPTASKPEINCMSKWPFDAVSKPDCGEYGHAEGACGNVQCMSKPEPQAQAEEPEVVAEVYSAHYGNRVRNIGFADVRATVPREKLKIGDKLITLQSHREAMEKGIRLVDDHWQEIFDALNEAITQGQEAFKS